MYNLAQTFNIVDPKVFRVMGVRGNEDVDVPRAQIKKVLFIEESSKSRGVFDIGELLMELGPSCAQV